MWTICALCGAVVADEAVHTDWHTAHGDTLPTPAATTDPTTI